MLPASLYWIEESTSAEDTALALNHVVPAGQEPWLRFLYISASDGGDAWAWELDRPDGTRVIAGYGAVSIDFGSEGFKVPGTAGADLRIDIAKTGPGTTARAYMMGVDRGVPGI